MDKFKIPQDEKIPEQNQRILDELKMAFGFIPNVYAFIAYSPVCFEELFTFYPGENFSDRQGSRSYLFGNQPGE